MQGCHSLPVFEVAHATLNVSGPQAECSALAFQPFPRDQSPQTMRRLENGALQLQCAGTFTAKATFHVPCAALAHNIALIQDICSTKTCSGLTHFAGLNHFAACADAPVFDACSCDDDSACQLSISRYVEDSTVVRLRTTGAILGMNVTANFTFQFFRGVGKCLIDQSTGPCGGKWDGYWQGDSGSDCSVEQVSETIDGRIEISSSDCSLSESGCNVPFLYRRLEGEAADSEWRLIVHVSESSDVQWSGGGLLVTLDENGSTTWLALFFEQGRWLWSGAASRGAALVDRRIARQANGIWLCLRRRRGGIFYAEWRTEIGDTWQPFGTPMTIPELQGRVRVGVAHQTASWNDGAASFDNFDLEVLSLETSAALDLTEKKRAALGIEGDSDCAQCITPEVCSLFGGYNWGEFAESILESQGCGPGGGGAFGVVGADVLFPCMSLMFFLGVGLLCFHLCRPRKYRVQIL